MNDGPREHATYRRNEAEAKLAKLGALATHIESLVEDHPERPVAVVPPTPASNKVFIVHGHDEAALHATARFLEKLRLEPVILHEQRDGGRTIIEKFEQEADVAFAVVLLTPDDQGAAVASEDLQPRARQNVVLELGYFIGRLGRQAVCALYKEQVEVPSDFAGVLYVPMSGDWKLRLAKELKGVFASIDMNDAV